MSRDRLFDSGSIGPVEVRNRIVRAGTSEAMGDAGGAVTDQLVALYEEIARNRVGLMITGHLHVERRGMYVDGQTGIDRDDLVPGLARVADAAHRHGAKVFAEIAHAGSQSRVPDSVPLAPSPVPNELTGREVAGASEEEIDAVLDAFAAGGRRAAEAGFDGVHIHGANGYLISEFSSPLANRRTDAWGGSPEARDRFPLELVRRVRAEVPAEMAVTMKVGFFDAVDDPQALTVAESVRRSGPLVDAGLDAIEVSSNVMSLPSDSAATYVAVDRRRAFEDLLFHRLHKGAEPEAYFLPLARALRRDVDTKVILVGGLRTRETLEAMVADDAVDFVAMARPFIREPDIAGQLEAGRTGLVDCVSCNICLMHEGHHTLRCWRKPRYRLLQHAGYRFSGGFKRAPTVALKRH